MGKKRIVKPGKWWIVRFRQMRSYARITAIRTEQIRSWMKDHNGILEILEVEGCLFYHTVSSEKVIERQFNTTNEMEILAIECALGEV